MNVAFNLYLQWEKLSVMKMLERCMSVASDTWIRAVILRQIKILGKIINDKGIL
jgi:hypothetical protein